MPSGRRRAVCLIALVAALATSACGGVLREEHEYEEELYLGLDGSATVYVNSSVAALVALRGLDLNPDPYARLDRQKVRELFRRTGSVPVVNLSRRDGRRFVHVRIDVDDVRRLPEIAPLAWSTYRFDRRDEVLEFRQSVGAAEGKPVGDVGWDGTEVVRFKVHLPSEILYENADGDVERGNILEWEQPLTARLAGDALLLEAHIATESILQQTLLLFGSTIVAAAVTFGGVIWWVLRRGRAAEIQERRQGVAAGRAESHP
jgi:hypothetical protein